QAIDDEYHHIDIVQRLARRLVHHAIDRPRFVAMQAGGIDIDDLDVALGLDAEHAVARGLRLARGDADLLPEQVIEQRRLADIGTPDQGDITATRTVVPGIVIHDCRSR